MAEAGKNPGGMVVSAFRFYALGDLVKTQGVRGKRQAELDSWTRLQNEMDFNAWKTANNVVLVDDFITTGHTVREAARSLKMSGVRTVHVFGLGARTQEVGVLNAVAAPGPKNNRT